MELGKPKPKNDAVGGECAETDPVSQPDRARVFLRLGLGFVVVGLALIGVFGTADWYADRVSMMRYCDDPEGATALVVRVLTDPRPAGAGPTRGHAVAAKLLFLVPRRQSEDTQAYGTRLRHRIEEACRKRAAALSSRSM